MSKAYADMERTIERDPRTDPWPGDMWVVHTSGGQTLTPALAGKLARLQGALLPDLTYVLHPVIEVGEGKVARYPMDIRDPRMAETWSAWAFYAPSAHRVGPPPFGATLFEASFDPPELFAGDFYHPKGPGDLSDLPDPIDALPGWKLLEDVFKTLPRPEAPTPADVWALLEQLVQDGAKRQGAADARHAMGLARELDRARTTMKELRAVVQNQNNKARENVDALRRARFAIEERDGLREELELARAEVEALQQRLRDQGNRPAAKVRAPPNAERILRDVLAIIHPDTCKHPKAADVTAQVNALRDSFRDP